MATTFLPGDKFDTTNKDKNLELFSLVWLDANVNVSKNRNTQQTLRTIINNFKKFQNVQECQEYIERRSKEERLVLIVSGSLGREIVPSIHNLRQVSSIYVYCMDKERNEQWAYTFPKVKDVVVKLDELVSQIKANYKIQKKVEEPLSVNMFSTGKSTTGVNGKFVYSQVLIDCLLRMRPNQIDKEELISCCTKEYKGNEFELNNLREFWTAYSPNKALSWYTRESFFYKTLNTALRTQNIHMIYLFHSYIADIHRQLQFHQAKCPVRVYRTQLISSDELDALKKWKGQFISVNSFFSTSMDYTTALSFLDRSTSRDLERVLFEIDADPHMVTTKPFAEISAHSEFADEAEVLFMIGSIFRLNSVSRRDEQVWIIRMSFCSDDEHDLKQVLAHMKNQTGNGETNLHIFGKILWEMGKFDLAEKYYCRFVNELPPNDPSLSTLYEVLAQITAHKGDYDISMQWRQKSLEIKQQTPSTSSSKQNKRLSAIVIPNIPHNARWQQNGVTVAGGNGKGAAFNQLNCPWGLCVEGETVFIADTQNHRIVEWKPDATSGQVVAGGNGQGNGTHQLNWPTDVILDKETDSLIICDYGNRRVMRWFLRNRTSGELIIENIRCWGLAMDDQKSLYVSDVDNHAVRQYREGETNGTVVAGGNGGGDRLSQLNGPHYIFVDRNHSVYVTHCLNHRVMKWVKGAKEGIVVAGQEIGNALTQLCGPQGVFVDSFDRVYVADQWNNRVMCWCPGATQGNVVAGGNGVGRQANQLYAPGGLSFDRHGNLYVVDWGNHRVQRFSIN